MAFMRWLHKWLGLIVGIQMTIWLLSGLMMSSFPMGAVSGADRASSVRASLSGPVRSDGLAALRAAAEQAHSVTIRDIAGETVYQIASDDGLRTISARSGDPFPITGKTAATIAERDYAGATSVAAVTALEAPFLELRDHEGPVWRVDFDDDRETTLYVDRITGDVLIRRNDVWRVFDVFWMLHTMDYVGRDNFNNPLIIMAGISALWLALSGFVTLFSSFSWRDFNLVAAARRWGGRKVACSIAAPDAEPESVRLSPGLSYFDALGATGVRLPSNCGGAGTCGLCAVRIEPDRAPSAADRRLLSGAEVRDGLRLACQHRTRGDDLVQVPEGVLAVEPFAGRIESARFIAPFIKEITVRLDRPPARKIVSGQYVQVEIPPGEVETDTFEIPEGFQAAWFEQGLPAKIQTPGDQRRSYSMATAPHEDPSIIVLNVRAVPPAGKGHSWGAGSGYIFSLSQGAPITLHGPFGRFRPTEHAKELVLIGGGSGMAPLRSILRHEYSRYGAGRPATFFYGARTEDDILYRKEFEALAKERVEFRWVVALSEPTPKSHWTGPRGYIHEIAEAQLESWGEALRQTEFLLCGPPALIEASRAMLEKIGVPSEHVHVEDFGV